MRANILSIGFMASGSVMFLTIGILVFSSREPMHAPHQEANMPVAELRLDLQDVSTLLAISQRSSVKAALSSQAKRIERQIQRQEALISDGDRLYAAAIRHLGNSPHSAQAKLELSAAKSAYQRAAAAEKVEAAVLLEETILEAERAINERASERGQDPGTFGPEGTKQLVAAIKLPREHNATAAGASLPGAAPHAPNTTLGSDRGAALKVAVAADAKRAGSQGVGVVKKPAAASALTATSAQQQPALGPVA
eukprot:CAMPEP_0169436642 /NCGR_PEP_ID=MMETSP1042-20121227/5704_1 /TAXON_ID=464988 /ORGANISM="Hemiselmis andersenii, Strain CCMP1180" /LENGTH=251 /DNA_ID=CAMNT_0009547363 /DNA_START=269 /DNA_END=1021 /DNA_ORIENTATION=+